MLRFLFAPGNIVLEDCNSQNEHILYSKKLGVGRVLGAALLVANKLQVRQGGNTSHTTNKGSLTVSLIAPLSFFFFLSSSISLYCARNTNCLVLCYTA